MLFCFFCFMFSSFLTLQSHTLYIPTLRFAVLEFAILNKLHENLTGCHLVGTGLAELLERAAWGIK